jgi:hypothetical protein
VRSTTFTLDFPMSHAFRFISRSVPASPDGTSNTLGKLVLVALTLIAGSAQAQNAPTKLTDDAPRLERLEEGEQPAVTIRKPEEKKGTTVMRDANGNITETRVETGKTTYFVRPNRQPGNSQPGDLQSSGNRAAQFKVKEFGPGAKKKELPENDPQTLEPASPLPKR